MRHYPSLLGWFCHGHGRWLPGLIVHCFHGCPPVLRVTLHAGARDRSEAVHRLSIFLATAAFYAAAHDADASGPRTRSVSATD
jgi:hypothetical protein